MSIESGNYSPLITSSSYERRLSTYVQKENRKDVAIVVGVNTIGLAILGVMIYFAVDFSNQYDKCETTGDCQRLFKVSHFMNFIVAITVFIELATLIFSCGYFGCAISKRNRLSKPATIEYFLKSLKNDTPIVINMQWGVSFKEFINMEILTEELLETLNGFIARYKSLKDKDNKAWDESTLAKIQEKINTVNPELETFRSEWNVFVEKLISHIKTKLSEIEESSKNPFQYV